MTIEPTFSDSMFIYPYVDMDEWRNEPVCHRYVHGRLKGIDTRFTQWPSNKN